MGGRTLNHERPEGPNCSGRPNDSRLGRVEIGRAGGLRPNKTRNEKLFPFYIFFLFASNAPLCPSVLNPPLTTTHHRQTRSTAAPSARDFTRYKLLFFVEFHDPLRTQNK